MERLEHSCIIYMQDQKSNLGPHDPKTHVLQQTSFTIKSQTYKVLPPGSLVCTYYSLNDYV